MANKPKTSMPKSQDGLNSTAKGTLEVLITSAKSLASDQIVDHILELFDKIPDLEVAIESKDKQIQTLEAEMEKSTADHKISHQQSLLTYAASRDELNSQLQSLDGNVTSLKCELEQKDETIEALKNENASLTHTIEKSTETAKVQHEETEKAGIKIKALEDSLETSENANEKSRTALEQQGHRLSQLEAARKRLQSEHDNLNKLHRSSTQQLIDAQGLTVTLNSEDPEQTMLQLDRVWLAASKLVWSNFFQDIPDVVMQDGTVWNHIKQPRRWDHSLPIPQSNSTGAKQMRSVVILATLVRAIDFYIFQPTYFLPPDGKIRNLLIRQAQDESRKESAFRAMMQALLPKEQDTDATKRVLQACDEIMLDVGGLLSSDAALKFKENLKDIAEDARDIWQKVRLLTDAVEPSFVLQYYRDWSWHQVRFQETQIFIEEGTQTASTGKDKPMFVIFPRFLSWDNEGEYPVTHGVLIMKSQTLAAREEMQQPSSPGVERRNSISTRRQKVYKPSTGTQSNHDESEPRPFLGGYSGGRS